MATVYISQEHSELVKTLASNNKNNPSIFKTNMHLFIFAALLGKNIDDEYTQYQVQNQGNEIPDRIFFNNQMDSAIYLLALHAKKNGDILREKNENECFKIVEQYAEHGFQEIKNWFIDNPGTPEIDIILNKMKQEATSLLAETKEIDTSKIEF